MNILSKELHTFSNWLQELANFSHRTFLMLPSWVEETADGHVVDVDADEPMTSLQARIMNNCRFQLESDL
jgi:hypothetical protein